MTTPQIPTSAAAHSAAPLSGTAASKSDSCDGSALALTRLVLVTGLSGCGKSALSRHLNALGERAISLDGAPDLCRWEDVHGHSVTRPGQPDLAWLRAHAWNWSPEILDTLLAAERGHGAQRVFLCGTAGNQEQLLDRFDLVVMLDIDQPTMLARVSNASRGNDFGRVGGSRDLLAERFVVDRRRMIATCQHLVDARLPIAVVTNMIIGLLDGAKTRSSPIPTIGAANRVPDDVRYLP